MKTWSRLLTVLAALLVGSPHALGATGDSADDGGPDEPGTVVATRAPKEKRPQKVRQKFFSKAKRWEFAPFFGFVSNNPFNQDVVVGGAVAYHFTERVGLQFQGQWALMSGASNEKGLAGAVLQLLQREQGYLLEATDPKIYANIDLLFSPMYGKINPMGIGVINLDFYFAIGAGYFNETVEMVGLEGTSLYISTEQDNNLFAFNLGLGMKVFATRFAAIRVDARFYLTLDETLDYSNDENAQDNHHLDPALANRLSCDGPAGQSVARCTTTLSNSFVVTVGGSFFVPGMKRSQTVATR